jgi:hypothetical protein
VWEEYQFAGRSGAGYDRGDSTTFGPKPVPADSRRSLPIATLPPTILESPWLPPVRDHPPLAVVIHGSLPALWLSHCSVVWGSGHGAVLHPPQLTRLLAPPRRGEISGRNSPIHPPTEPAKPTLQSPR